MKKLCFIFPGYKSHYVGMGKDFYDNSRVVQEYFEQASQCLNINFTKLCFASSENELAKPQQAYPALFLVSSAVARLLQDEGIVPTAAVGFGLGTFSALHAGGALSSADGLYFLSKYAQMYQEFLDTHEDVFEGLRIEGMNRSDLKRLIAECNNGHTVSIMAYAASDVHYIAGPTDVMTTIEKTLFDKVGVRVEDYSIEGGMYNTEIMHTVVKQLEPYLNKIDIKSMSIPLIVSATDRLTDADAVRAYTIEQCEQSIDFVGSMHACCTEYDLVVQVGPGTVLKDLIIRDFPDKKVISVNSYNDIQDIKTYIGI